MKRQLKKVGGMIIVLAAALASTPAFADLFVGGSIAGGVSVNSWQTGFVSADAAGTAVVAGPFGVSVGSVQLGGTGNVVGGGGSAQFGTQGQVVQSGWQVQTAAGAVSSVTVWGGAGQAFSSAFSSFQRF